MERFANSLEGRAGLTAEEAPLKEAREKAWKIIGDNYQYLKWRGGNLKQFTSKDPHLLGQDGKNRQRKEENRKNEFLRLKTFETVKYDQANT